MKMFATSALLALLLLPGTARSADVMPAEVKKDDKCRVCGMFVAKYRNWISQIVFSGGTAAFFDGPKDMMKYYLDPGKYDPGKKADIAAIFVTDYYSLKLIDGRAAFYVIGSDVFGPMGAELVPLANETQARGFLKDHKGAKVLKFDEIRPEHLQ